MERESCKLTTQCTTDFVTYDPRLELPREGELPFLFVTTWVAAVICLIVKINTDPWGRAVTQGERVGEGLDICLFGTFFTIELKGWRANHIFSKIK